MLGSELLRTPALKGKGAEAFEQGGGAFIRNFPYIPKPTPSRMGAPNRLAILPLSFESTYPGSAPREAGVCQPILGGHQGRLV
jgi:hypothetical protein